MSKNNHRLSVFITGIILLLVIFASIFKINTAFCGQVEEGMTVSFEKQQLFSLDGIMKPVPQDGQENTAAESRVTSRGRLLLPADIFNAGAGEAPMLYIPGSGSRLWINGCKAHSDSDSEYIAVNLKDYLQEENTGENNAVFEIELSTRSGDSTTAGRLIFLGSHRRINGLISAAIFQRFFVIGMSFTVLLYSISLYIEKRSEKYLLLLALLSYSTSARTLWNAIPALKSMLIPNILLLGTVNIPGATASASYYVSYMALKFLIAFMRFLLIREFITVKISRRRYLEMCAAVLVVLLPFCFTGKGYLASQIFIMAMHLSEFVMFITCTGRNYKTFFTIILAWSITVALRIFDILSVCNAIPHGLIDAGVKMQGIVETFYTIAFVIIINLKFARKYREAEQLSVSLESMNRNLEALVSQRTEELTERNGELTAAYGRLNEVQRQKDEFMTNIIHNLKTPLFSLYGYADMAMDELEDAPELARKHLEEINTNTSYAKQLIDNLFLCMRLEDGKIKYNPMPFNVSLLLAQLDSTSRARTEAAGIALKVDMPEKDVYLTADLLYIRQALQNIIDNATRHSSAGTEISIRTEGRERDGKHYVTFIIKDCGEGIPEDEIPLIFGRYYSGGKKGASSSGLGLTITKEIIEQHGGFIEVESRLGVGSCFKISLPVNEDEKEE